MKYSKVLLSLLFVAAFLINIGFTYAAPIKIWDETVYLNLGTDLSRNLLNYSFDHGWSDFMGSAKEPYVYPNAGYRAPLLPYLIAFLTIFQASSFITYLMPFIGAASVVLVYLLGSVLFNKKAGFLAALFFAFIPLHLEHSGRVLTDGLLTFLLLLSVFSFWKGFEKGDNTYKIFFGVFLALALLSRYTALWIFPVFLLYVLVRGTIVQLVHDKYLWFAIIAFGIVLLPWLIYGYFTYGNPLGPFIHGSIATNYWGGAQSWYHFFNYWWQMFSVVGFLLLFCIMFIIYKRAFLKKEIIFLLIWFAFFLGFAIYQPHKEERFLLPIVPAMVLLTGYVLDRFKHHTKKIVVLTLVVLLMTAGLSAYRLYKENHTVNTRCYQEIGEKLQALKGEYLIVSESSSLFRNLSQQETRYYPDTISETTIDDLARSTEKRVLFIMTQYNAGFSTEKVKNLQEILRKKYDVVYECPQYKEMHWMYLKADHSRLENLIPNGSFESEAEDLWVTNTSASVDMDETNRGVDPDPLKSAKITGFSQEADLHTSSIAVEQGGLYQFKVFVDASELESGELGFIIDEYNQSKQWIGAVWAGSADLKTTGYHGSLYIPKSPGVHSIRVHTYLEKNAKGSVYLDNYQLYKIN